MTQLRPFSGHYTVWMKIEFVSLWKSDNNSLMRKKQREEKEKKMKVDANELMRFSNGTVWRLTCPFFMYSGGDILFRHMKELRS